MNVASADLEALASQSVVADLAHCNATVTPRTAQQHDVNCVGQILGVAHMRL